MSRQCRDPVLPPVSSISAPIDIAFLHARDAHVRRTRTSLNARAFLCPTARLFFLASLGSRLASPSRSRAGSPSRCSLQTGRNPLHVNAINTGVLVHNPVDPVSGFQGIPRNMTGVAEKMHAAGYRTAMTGKWDAGMATPQVRGGTRHQP